MSDVFLMDLNINNIGSFSMQHLSSRKNLFSREGKIKQQSDHALMCVYIGSEYIPGPEVDCYAPWPLFCLYSVFFCPHF